MLTLLEIIAKIEGTFYKNGKHIPRVILSRDTHPPPASGWIPAWNISDIFGYMLFDVNLQRSYLESMVNALNQVLVGYATLDSNGNYVSSNENDYPRLSEESNEYNLTKYLRDAAVKTLGYGSLTVEDASALIAEALRYINPSNDVSRETTHLIATLNKDMDDDDRYGIRAKLYCDVRSALDYQNLLTLMGARGNKGTMRKFFYLYTLFSGNEIVPKNKNEPRYVTMVPNLPLNSDPYNDKSTSVIYHSRSALGTIFFLEFFSSLSGLYALDSELFFDDE